MCAVQASLQTGRLLRVGMHGMSHDLLDLPHHRTRTLVNHIMTSSCCLGDESTFTLCHRISAEYQAYNNNMYY